MNYAVESTNIIHNPPSCTCQRIIWLSEHCDRFSLNVTPHGSQIQAQLAEIALDNAFEYPLLREEVAGVFWQIWHCWQPESGIKIE